MDLRRFGGCKHAGFGLGFDRMLMYLSGMQNIRDVEPFAAHAEKPCILRNEETADVPLFSYDFLVLHTLYFSLFLIYLLCINFALQQA